MYFSVYTLNDIDQLIQIHMFIPQTICFIIFISLVYSNQYVAMRFPRVVFVLEYNDVKKCSWWS